MRYDYDVIVIGGGAAGFTVSKTLSGMGKKVAIIEKNKLGGECTWYGCVPSKSLIKIAEKFYSKNFLNQYGFNLKQDNIDTEKVMDYVHSKVESVYNTHKPETFKKSGIDIIFGSSEFINNHKIKINDTELCAKIFVLATGSSAFIPPIPGLKEVDWLDNEKFFKLKKLPESLIVLGAGPIGIELSQSLNRLGVKTTVVEMMDRIMFREDKELVLMLQQKLIDEGVDIQTSTKAVKVEQKNNKIILSVEKKDGIKETITADDILVAVGRKPNLDGLYLENAGIKYDKKGVKTDKYLRTTASNIFACGDIVPPYQFSHVSEYEGVIVGINIVSPIKRKVEYTNVLWATFTEPELARTGLTEEEAREKYGSNIKIFKYNYSEIDRAKTDSSEFGLAKFILYKNNIIGAHILGERAGDIIHESQILKTLNIPFHKLQKVMHAYPSYADISRQISKKVYIDKLQNNFFIKIIKKIMGK